MRPIARLLVYPRQRWLRKCGPNQSRSEQLRCNASHVRISPRVFSQAASSSSQQGAAPPISHRRGDDDRATEQSWSEEWRRIGLGARLPPPGARMTNLLFVQTGFGVDQHGDRTREGATKAAVRAVRNAIEFNAIPGAIESIPGGRNEMLIQVKLGVPPRRTESRVERLEPMAIDLSHVAKVFPYGRLMPIEVVVGGLSFPTGRIVCELGDVDDIAICVAASVSIGYDKKSVLLDGKCHVEDDDNTDTSHKIYRTDNGH